MESSIVRLDRRAGTRETVDTAYYAISDLKILGTRLLATVSHFPNPAFGSSGHDVFYLEGADLGGGFGDFGGGGGGGEGGGGGN